MTSENQLTIDYVRLTAERAGLALAEEEAVRLLDGLKRGRAMTQAVRRVVTPEAEPAPVFGAVPPEPLGR